MQQTITTAEKSLFNVSERKHMKGEGGEAAWE
jgi:hypothetical protein